MKYEVSLEAIWPVIKTLIIEAESMGEAEDIALQMAKDDEVDWDMCSSDCIRSVEAVDVEYYEGDEEADNEGEEE